MANQIFLLDIAPVKLFLQNQTLDTKYHLWHFNEASFADSILYFQERKIYFQKWQQSDRIYLQLVTNYGPVTARLVDSDGNVRYTATVNTITQSFYTTPFAASEVILDFSGVAEGVYYLQVLVGSSGSETILISDPMIVAADWSNTLYYEYTHGQNEYGAIFQNGETFCFRAEGVIDTYTPGIRETVFEDEPANVVRLSSTMHRNFKLSIGAEDGVPDWVADKVNRIFGCDTVLIDGKQYVRPENAKMDPKGEDNYPMRGWQMDIRESKNRNGLSIQNNIPQNNSVVVIYVAETSLFGLSGDAYIDKVE